MIIYNNLIFALLLLLCSDLIHAARKLKTSQKYQKNVFLASLADQCGRFDDMTEFLNELSRTKTEINVDERDLIISAYKNNLAQRKPTLNTLEAYQLKERKKEASPYLSYIIEYKKKIESEQLALCNKLITNIDSFILPKVEDDESKVMILLLKAEIYRNIVRILQGDSKYQFIDFVKSTYNAAKSHTDMLSPINRAKLQLALDLSNFTYEVLNEEQIAINIIKSSVADAKKELQSFDDNDEMYRDAFSLVNLMEENLTMWIIDE
jgi:hypothetical protein